MFTPLFLPGTGRGTAARRAGVEGDHPERTALKSEHSGSRCRLQTSSIHDRNSRGEPPPPASLVPLPVPGRIPLRKQPSP